MEELSEVQRQENKALPEKNKRRQFKTTSQLQALEDFYNEHKYPTELMKAELAQKIGLTEKQISGWFCHRRLKDKKVIRGETIAVGRQEISSGVIQDRGSGLRQDSCSSTKQGDYRLADLREVESRRFSHEDLPAAQLNYEQRGFDGNEMDDTSSESNLALQETYYPDNRSPLDVGTTEYRATNGFNTQSRRVRPSGYLKIKGRTENAAITAVKRQLGRHYWEDGPPLGIEFDPLPPGAFEPASKNTNTDGYGVPEPIGSSSFDIPGIHKRPGLRTMRNQDMYAEATDYRSLHKSDPDSFSYHQPKQKPTFPGHGHSFPGQKSSFGVDSRYARETSGYDSSLNHSIQHKHDLPAIRSDSYGGKLATEPEEPWSPNYDDVNPMAVHRRERFVSRPAAVSVRHKDLINKEDRVPPSRMMKAGKRGREEFLQEDYAIRTSSQELPRWSKQIKGDCVPYRSAEIPSSFSEDETAETSSSMD